MTDLSKFDNSDYNPGSILARVLWHFISIVFFESKWFTPFGPKRFLLRLFGAKIGRGVVIKPRVTIKYPWFLEIGNYSWIGEQVWIDNLAMTRIGSNACLSQGTLLLTGNHDYSSITFDLMAKPIAIGDAAWIGAKAVVCPGVTIGNKTVLTVGSVATRDAEPSMIYQGNPAKAIMPRPEIK